MDSRSSDTNWATKLVGNKFECVRKAKKIISVDEFALALAEYAEPEDIDKCIRKGRTRIIDEPDRMDLNKVNELVKEGGLVAEQIEKVTEKVSNGITIKQKETK